MWHWFKRLFGDTAIRGELCLQPHGELFPWPKGVLITAVDELIISVPMALFEDDRPLNDAVNGPDNMEISFDAENNVCFLRLQPGTVVSVNKSTQAYIVSEDRKPRRLKVDFPTPTPR